MTPILLCFLAFPAMISAQHCRPKRHTNACGKVSLPLIEEDVCDPKATETPLMKKVLAGSECYLNIKGCTNGYYLKHSADEDGKITECTKITSLPTIYSKKGEFFADGIGKILAVQGCSL